MKAEITYCEVMDICDDATKPEETKREERAQLEIQDDNGKPRYIKLVKLASKGAAAQSNALDILIQEYKDHVRNQTLKFQKKTIQLT